MLHIKPAGAVRAARGFTVAKNPADKYLSNYVGRFGLSAESKALTHRVVREHRAEVAFNFSISKNVKKSFISF